MRASWEGGAGTSELKAESPAKKATTTVSRRNRIAITLLAIWALVASIAFGWTWAADEQARQAQEQSIRATIDWIVWGIGDHYSAASGQLFDLSPQALYWGWMADVHLGDVYFQDVTELVQSPEGASVISALFGDADLLCPVNRVNDILVSAGSNPSILNGTNAFTTYIAEVVNLTASLGRNFAAIAGSGNNPLDHLGSPPAAGIRSEEATLSGLGCT